MKSHVLVGLVSLLIVSLVAGEAAARGRGGGGRGGGGRGGGGRSMGGGGRSAPSMSRSHSYNNQRGNIAQRGGHSSAGSRQLPSRTQPGNRAGQLPNRGQAGTRPNQLPNRGQAGDRSGQGFLGQGQAGNRAGQPSNRGGQVANRRDARPAGRPSQNDINRFLNISPGTGAAVAGGVAAGAAVGNRDARPSTRERRPGGEPRNQRADSRQDRRETRPNSPQDRVERRHDRAQDVRQNLRHHPSILPHNGFWRDHPHWAHWHVNRPYRWATWGALGAWYAITGDGLYYDYGTGGNCYYEGDTVYYEGEPIATTEEYADQAIGFAETGAEVIDEAIASDADIEWMPLGVFALVHEEDGDPIFFMQLQIAKDGTISGTYTNSVKNTTQTIQGSVDKESQRAAWTVGDNSNTVIETGLYNLTKDEAPALIHFGTEKTQEWLLVRMEEPDDAQDTP